MKNLQVLSPLLASLLLASMALAQAVNLPDAPQLQASDPPTQPSSENKLVSQARPFPRSPRSPMPDPRGRAYPSAFAPRPPALSPVGALIGFGTGAALGAAGSQDHTTGGRAAAGLLGGALCALIGGAVGNAFSVVHTHSFRNWKDTDAQERKHRKAIPRRIEPDTEASSAPVRPAPAGSL